jgi:hypothetical protein
LRRASAHRELAAVHLSKLLANNAMALFQKCHRAVVTRLQQRFFRSLVVVVTTEVDPLPSVRCPASPPAAVVRSIGKRSAKEREATEAMMEAMVPERKMTVMETVVAEGKAVVPETRV